MDSTSVLIVFIVFASMASVLLGAFYFAHRSRRAVYDTIRAVIEKTGEATPDLIKEIQRDRIGKFADLRKGILFVAAAAAFAILSLVVDDPDAVGPMLGVAAFPGLIGAAYILFHFMAPRDAD